MKSVVVVLAAMTSLLGANSSFAQTPPPAECAYKFIGTWTYAGGTTDVLPNGKAIPHCFFCVPYQNWTCSGDTYTFSNPDGQTWSSTLQPGGAVMISGSGTATRVGGPAKAPASQGPAIDPHKRLSPEQLQSRASQTGESQRTSGCPEGFSWVGGYLCAAYNVDAGSCASKGGRFIEPKIVGAPTRCETDTQVANAAPNRPGTTAQGGGTTSGGPAVAGVPGGGIAPDPSQQPTQRRMGTGTAPASGGHCVDYFGTMKKEFWELALQCANQAEALTNMVDFFNAYGVQRGYSPDEIKRSAGNTIYPLVRDNDPGWFKSGDSILPNCSQPLQVERQSKSFTECLRVYSCAYAAASCGEQAGPQLPNTPCSAISAQCLAKNPIPQ